MNKKYFICSLLMMFLMISKPSFSMDNNDKNSGYLWQSFAIGATLGAALPHLLGKMMASIYEDVTPETQKWAIKVLEESGIKGVDKISFKKAKDEQGWEARYDYFITIPEDFDPLKCARQKCLEGEFLLKHEVKHVQNYDITKRTALMVGIIAVSCVLAKEKSFITIPFVPLGYGTNMVYCKYQESEADRFAYERARSREELIAAKNYFIQIRTKYEKEFLQRREDDLLKLKSLRATNGIEEKEFQNKKDKIFSMLRNKDMLLDITEFIGDREHPSLKSRAGMAQDYIQKWDKDHSVGERS